MKKQTVLAAAGFIVLMLCMLWSRQSLALATTTNKINICHKSGSSGNYTLNSVNDDSIVNKSGNHCYVVSNGHGTHSGDIIPAFTSHEGCYFSGKNTSKTDWIANGCQQPPTATPTTAPTEEPTATPTTVPTVTVEPTVTPTEEVTPTPTEEITPTPTDEVTPTPTKEPEITPTVIPTVKVETKSGDSSQGWHPPAPRDYTCRLDRPEKPVANFHLYRKGDVAQLKWLPAGQNAPTVNVYYKLVTSGNWEHSVIAAANTGFLEIRGLDDRDFTFAIAQNNGCIEGDMTSPIVDGNTDGWVLFR